MNRKKTLVVATRTTKVFSKNKTLLYVDYVFVAWRLKMVLRANFLTIDKY